MGSIVQLEILGHRSTAGYQNAQIGAFIAEIAWPADAKEEGLTLALHRTPVIVETCVAYAAVGIETPDAGLRSGSQHVDRILDMLDHHLAPGVDVVAVGPARVQRIDIELEVDPAELEQMKHEQRQIGMGEGGVICHRAGARDPGIEFAEINLAAFLVDQEVELEVAAITFLAKLLAEPEGQVASMRPDPGREGIGKNLVAAPAALVGSQFRETDEFGHKWADHRARARGATLDRRLAAIDPLHDLQLALGGDLRGVALPIRFIGNEICCVTGIAEGRLDDQILTQLLRRLAQFGIAFHGSQHVGNRWHACLVADAYGLDLVVETVPQPGAGKPDLHVQLAG